METPLEQALKNSYKAGMISYLDSHPEDFNELLELATTDKLPYSWRAAWLLSNYIEKNDERVRPCVPAIVETLSKTGDSQPRDLINVLRKMEIDEEYEGAVFEICIEVWSKISKIPSVRSNALKLALKIVEKHPVLYDEIVFITEDHYIESLSKGIQHSIRKTLHALSKQLGR